MEEKKKKEEEAFGHLLNKFISLKQLVNVDTFWLENEQIFNYAAADQIP